MPPSFADFIGADGTVAIGDIGQLAAWIQLIISGGGTIRLGGPNTDVNTGLPLPAGSSMFLPPRSNGVAGLYPLNAVRMYIPVGTTVSVMIG